MFLDYKPQHNSAKDQSKVYNDYINHCKSWQRMMEPGQKPTSAHECTHGTNSELRMIRDNNFGFKNIEDLLDIEPTYMITGEERIIAKDAFGNILWRPSPRGRNSSMLDEQQDGDGLKLVSATGRFNAFYLGNDKYVKLNEPPIRKSQVAQFVPQSMRSFRFSTYITGQTAWDDTPLYIYDEWTAYCAGVETALDLNKLGQSDGKGTDQPHGPLEFTIYSVALCMALRKLAPDYLTEEKDFKPFTLWNMIRAFNLYHYAMEKFPWPDSNRLIGVLRRDTNYTNFLKSEFNFTVPDGPIEGKEIDEKLFNIYRTS